MKNAAIYALRRTLPPWCFDERLAELVSFCRQTHVGEVIVKVDVEEFTHGIPTAEWLEAYMPKLTRARDALSEIGVAFSLNPWVTTGHLDRGRDLRGIFPEIDWMVGHRGEQCRACACPLSPGWRAHTRRLWQMYASLKPNVIWVEDDIRNFNHLPAEFACFCPLHMELFSKRIDKKVTRRQLVEAVLATGQPHPWREVWLDLQRDTIIDTCRFLAESVHEVSPQTTLGLMCSEPATHCLEGRDWHALAEALGAGEAIYCRPTLGNYSEEGLGGLYYCAEQIKRTRFMLPGGTIEQTEVENIPFTAYSKSVTFTFLQIAVSAAHGCDGATLNLFDHMGSPQANEPALWRMLAGEYPFIEAIVSANRPGGNFAGVRVLHHLRASYLRQLRDGDDYDALQPDDYAWERALNSLGFATTYTDSPVTAADGQMIAAYDDEQIRRMLSGGLLVDLTTAETLIARGFADQLGFEIDRTDGLHDSEAISAEELTDEAFGGDELRYLTMTLPDLMGSVRYARVKPHKGARPISRLVDPDRKVVCPFATIFENALGGRVAVLPLDLREALGPAFLHAYRQIQMRAILGWLSRGKLPAAVTGGVYPLPARTDLPGRVLLSVFNLSHDNWPQVVWDIHLPAGPAGNVEMLQADGKWTPAPVNVERTSPDRLRITAALELSFRRPLVLRINLS